MIVVRCLIATAKNVRPVTQIYPEQGFGGFLSQSQLKL